MTLGRVQHSTVHHGGGGGGDTFRHVHVHFHVYVKLLYDRKSPKAAATISTPTWTLLPIVPQPPARPPAKTTLPNSTVNYGLHAPLSFPQSRQQTANGKRQTTSDVRRGNQLKRMPVRPSPSPRYQSCLLHALQYSTVHYTKNSTIYCSVLYCSVQQANKQANPGVVELISFLRPDG